MTKTGYAIPFKIWQQFWGRIGMMAALVVFMAGPWWWRTYWFDLNRDSWYAIHYGVAPFMLVAVIAWILGGGRGLRELFISNNFLWAMLLLTLGLWTWVAIPPDVRNGQVAHSAAVQLSLVLAFAVRILADGPPARMIAAALILGMTLQAALGITQTALQHDVGLRQLDEALGWGVRIRELPLDPQREGVSVLENDGQRILRPYGLSAHPNPFAGGLVMGLCALLPFWSVARWRGWAALLTVIGLWALLLSFSRAALGGLVVGCMVAALLSWLSTRNFHTLSVATQGFGLAFLLTCGFTVTVFSLWYWPLVAGRFGNGSTDDGPTFEDYSAASRAVYEEQARALIRANRWRGVGIGNFEWESASLLKNDWRDLRGAPVHNIYLLVQAEIGLIGSGLFLAAMGFSLILASVRTIRGQLHLAQIGLIAGGVAWLAIGWFDHYPWTQMGHAAMLWGAMAGGLAHQPDLS